jgi:hypothetical protein
VRPAAAPFTHLHLRRLLPQVAVDVVHHKTMQELHQKVAPAQIIVGW